MHVHVHGLYSGATIRTGAAIKRLSVAFLGLVIKMSVPNVAGAPEQKEAHRANFEPVGESCGRISSTVTGAFGSNGRREQVRGEVHHEQRNVLLHKVDKQIFKVRVQQDSRM